MNEKVLEAPNTSRESTVRVLNKLNHEDREKLAGILLLQRSDINSQKYQIELTQTAHLVKLDSVMPVGAKNIIKYLIRAKSNYSYYDPENLIDKAIRIFQESPPRTVVNLPKVKPEGAA